MGSSSSSPAREEDKEEDTDLDFHESTTVVPIPPDPVVGTITDPNIEENIAGSTAISIANVKSVSLNHFARR